MRIPEERPAKRNQFRRKRPKIRNRNYSKPGLTPWCRHGRRQPEFATTSEMMVHTISRMPPAFSDSKNRLKVLESFSGQQPLLPFGQGKCFRYRAVPDVREGRYGKSGSGRIYELLPALFVQISKLGDPRDGCGHVQPELRPPFSIQLICGIIAARRMRTDEHWFIGECMIELRRSGDALLHQSFAGDVYNTAVYFHRSAPDCRACFVSSVGTDSMSAALLSHARKHGLHVEYIAATADRPPGLYLIETTPGGERTFLYWRSDSAARSMLEPVHFAALHQNRGACRLLYFSGITLAILDDARRSRLLELALAVKGHGGWVGFDSNYRAPLWRDADLARRWSTAALAACTHALVTFEDEVGLHGDASVDSTISRSLAGGAAEIVVKLGKDGCVVQSHSTSGMHAVPGERVTPVDTTAAGDSFNAAYLAARLAGAAPVQAAEAGNRLAARVVQVAGAVIDDDGK